MTTRAAAVAGTFYPGYEAPLRRLVEGFLEEVPRSPALAAVVPHAGLAYSGTVAGAVYSRIEIPQNVVLLCFHHRGKGNEISIASPGVWETPLGGVTVPSGLAGAVRETCGGAFDDRGHEGEHSGEVQLPFLQVVRPDVRVLPVALRGRPEALEKFGRNLARLKQEFLVLASTDLHHFGSHEETMARDERVIAPMLALDAPGLIKAVRKHDVSMCGTAPVLAMMAYARDRKRTRAELVTHCTSADAGGDREQTVGYAGIVVK